MIKKTKEALKWIIDILKNHNILFQITGGLAARIYGSNRPLADIDIEISDNKIFEIQNEVKKYIIFGPRRYKDKEFDLLLMTLKYKGQEIDICGIDSQKLYNKKAGKWIRESINLDKIKKKKVHGVIIPVISLKNLINYKKILSRDVDIQDVKTLQKVI